MLLDELLSPAVAGTTFQNVASLTEIKNKLQAKIVKDPFTDENGNNFDEIEVLHLYRY